MAAIQNLEVVVEVDISQALAALTELQDELSDLADDIENVDARGSEGIDIRTNVDQLDTELAALEAEIEAFEQANSIDLATDVNGADFGRAGGGGGGGAAVIDTMNVMAKDVRILSGSDLGFVSGGGGGVGGPNIADDVSEGVQDALDARSPAGRLTSGEGGGDSGRGGILSQLKGFARSARQATSSLSDFNLRMSDIHNALAALVPALLVFIGAIPAAYTALMTLAGAAMSAAAAFAVMAGLGALGAGLEGGNFDMENITEMWQDIKDSFIEAFAPLAERLQPLFEDAISGLERFFQAVSEEGDALMALTDEARSFGRFVTEFVPEALRTLAGLVESMAPVFGDLGGWIKENFNSVVRTFVEITLEALPALISLAKRIAGVLPALARMSVGFAAVASIVIDVLGLFGRLLGLLGLSNEQLGFVVAGLLAFASAVALANSALLGFVFKGIASAITSLYTFILSAHGATGALGRLGATAIGAALTGVMNLTRSLITSIASFFGFTVAASTAAKAAALFWTAVTLGGAIVLLGFVTSMASEFMGLSDSIDSATNSLKEFNRVSGKTDGSEFNPYGGGDDPPSGGGGGYHGGGGSGATNVTVETTGDDEQDHSNGQYAYWRAGRTSGSGA